MRESNGLRTYSSDRRHQASIDIAAPPESLWQAIIEDYIHGAKFGGDGYAIERLAWRSGIFGGYRMRLEKDGALLDDRIIHITERDDAARRLSLTDLAQSASG